MGPTYVWAVSYGTYGYKSYGYGGRVYTPHYGGYGTLGGYGGRYRSYSGRYKRMSETEADAGYDAYGYGYDSYGLGYGYREYGYGLYGYPLVGGYHFGPILSRYDLLFAGLKNVYNA